MKTVEEVAAMVDGDSVFNFSVYAMPALNFGK